MIFSRLLFASLANQSARLINIIYLSVYVRFLFSYDNVHNVYELLPSLNNNDAIMISIQIRITQILKIYRTRRNIPSFASYF